MPGKGLFLFWKLSAAVSFPCSCADPKFSAACKQSDAVQPLSLFLKNFSFSSLDISSLEGSPPWPHSSAGSGIKIKRGRH